VSISIAYPPHFFGEAVKNSCVFNTALTINCPPPPDFIYFPRFPDPITVTEGSTTHLQLQDCSKYRRGGRIWAKNSGTI
ncbi:MAG: hypothetical protein ACFNZE_06255, partial [Scardovia wiggsiae]